jgi:hypothetical protein
LCKSEDLRNQIVQAAINGTGAWMLSTGWLFHLLGEHVFLVPVLSGIGTAIYYFVCSDKFSIKFKTRLIFVLGSFTLIMGLLLKLDLLQTAFMGVFFTGLFFYIGIPGRSWNLRDVSGVKALFISVNWMFFVLILPLWLVRGDVSLPLIETFSFLLLFYALTIPSDIFDLHTDPVHLCTLPQVTGKKTATLLGIFLVLGFGAVQYLLSENTPWIFFSALASLLMCFPLLNSRFRTDVYTDALVFCAGCIYFL